jgi:uncharacterized protein YbcC (UPF0753/DUF2309 family)
MTVPVSRIRAHIEQAAESIGALWPLETFNSANPLSGFERYPFDEAVRRAHTVLRGRGYPSADVLRRAWERGEIDADRIRRRLEEAGVRPDPEAVLASMAEAEIDADAAASADSADRESTETLNRHLTKWLAAFLDQNPSRWPMPNREKGFYAAWRTVAARDADVPGIRSLADLPETPEEALRDVLEDIPEERWTTTFRYHLAALPGWCGFIKWRSRAQHSDWQRAHPISLGQYLAVRLIAARALNVPLAPNHASATLSPNGSSNAAQARVEGMNDNIPSDHVSAHDGSDDDAPLAAHWLQAWEETYREDLLDRLAETANLEPATDENHPSHAARPKAQWVFCIDVRSEILRRHLEATGHHETYGYAGFFGLPIQHEHYGSGLRVKSCPPIVDPKHRIADRRSEDRADEAERYDRWTRLAEAGRSLVKMLKDNLAAAFGFVEGSGAFFGAAMAGRTLLPEALYRWGERLSAYTSRPDQFCDPVIDRPTGSDDPVSGESDREGNGLPLGLSDEAKLLYAQAAFQLMGWTSDFAPVVVFTGHGSQTVNNPYKAGLDCGACAGNPGGPNARALAAICNDPNVRSGLREQGIEIPEDTVFLAAEHNTTTDEVTLFVDPEDPPVDATVIEDLQRDLKEARTHAAAERAETFAPRTASSGRRETQRRAADWAETRPEWGLAGNAGFIIGPRSLTQFLDLEGRCFLHSYDWSVDDDGTGLETIMTGPLVVGEWINMQYYFSTVDNAAYGSGSKTTQNVVGGIGIYQGNGGDLMSGLPLQSVRATDDRVFHRPLRLLAVVHAPVDRVETIVDRQDQLRQLFDHEWVALSVIDPERGNRVLRYEPGGTWADRSRASADREVSAPVAP